MALLFSGAVFTETNAQILESSTPSIDKAFKIATETLYKNVKDNLIKAGGRYGGEWTRDIAINAWNASNLLIPEVTRNSLWSVTTDNHSYIGHQFWDQIIWVTGAYDHYLATQDLDFLKQAYKTSKNSMQKLEKEAFDAEYGMFTGPSVFNDGIAGYEAPVFDIKLVTSTVLKHPGAWKIKCLSTNCIYYNAYEILAKMSVLCDDKAATATYLQKASTLRTNIRKYLLNEEKNALYYLIDQNGDPHKFQEGLGLSFAILFNIVSNEEAAEIVDKAYVAPYGIPSIYPNFKRFSKEKPGRHNTMIWPFVNAFFADAALQAGRPDKFVFELESLTQLCKFSKDSFYELYDPYTGRITGGYQTWNDKGIVEWESFYDQTWSATGYIRMILKGILGIEFTEQGLKIAPNSYLMKHIGFSAMKDLRYQQGKLQINKVGKGYSIREIRVNGMTAGKSEVVIAAPHSGVTTVDIVMGE